MEDCFDDIIYNDLDNDIEYEIYLKEQEESYCRFIYDKIYHDNGVEIGLSAQDMSCTIQTDKYTVYWYVAPCNVMDIFYNKKCVCSFKKDFDMSYFAEVRNPLSNPGKLEIISSSDSLVNKKVEKLLALRPFL